MNLSLKFDKGTLLVFGAEKHQLQFLNELSWDERTNSFRAPAAEYRKIVTDLRKNKIAGRAQQRLPGGRARRRKRV